MSEKYTSFEMLDDELKIARLQKDIDIQKIKNKVGRLKQKFNEDTKPKNVLGFIGTSIISHRNSLGQLLLGYVFRKIFYRRKR